MSFKSLHHSLDVNVACIYGTDEALLIHHFQHWISVNFRMKRNIHEGNCWTYQTLDEIAAHFPYMTKTRVADLLDRLCTGKSRHSKKESIDFDPILKKGNFNKSRYDRTVWYAFCDYTKWILGKPQMDEVEIPNQDGVNPTPVPDDRTDDITEEKEIYKEKAPQAGPRASPQSVSFGKFVHLTQEEYEALCKQHSIPLITEMIDRINDYLSSTGQKPYKDYAATLRNWIRRQKKSPHQTGQSDRWPKDKDGNRIDIREMIGDREVPF